MRRLLFLLLLAVNFYHAGLAHDHTWKQLIRKGEQAFKNGDYQVAVKHYELACSLMGKVPGKQYLVYASCLNELALSFQKMGSYAKAEGVYLEVLQIRGNTVGKQHPEYANTLNNLAGLYTSMGRYVEAEPMFLGVLQAFEKTLGRQHRDNAASLNDLAVLYCRIGRYTKAEPLFLEALEIRGKRLGKQHPDYAASLNELAGLYREVGSFAKAELLYLEALEIRGRSLGKHHPEYAASLNGLAMINHELGHYAEAEPLFLEALQIIEKKLDKGHPNYATCLNNLAVSLRGMGNYAKAEELFLEALQIEEKALGKAHPDYATCLNNLAVLYRGMGNYAKAEPLFLEALQIKEKAVGKFHPRFASDLCNLARLYHYMGSYGKAEKFYLEALQIFENTLGKQHPDYALSLNNLAILYDEVMGSYAKAEPLYLEALQIREKTVGKQHPRYATVIGNLARLYHHMGSYAKAEPFYLEALQIFENTLGKQHPDYATSLIYLVELYWHMGNYAKAETLYQETHQNLLVQISNYFPGLSEKERLAFYQGKIGKSFERFHSFALERQAENPLLKDQLFNNVLATKGLLFQSQNRIRNAIFSSGDSSLMKVYQEWQAQRNLLAKVYQMSLAQKQQASMDQAQLEKKVNDLEKLLSTRSEAFAQAADKTLYTWQQVQKSLKPGEAAVEMIRFRYHDKKWTDIIHYVALVITPASQHPDYILLSNGQELENKFSPLYHSSVHGRDIQPAKAASRRQTDAALLYQQFWSPIGNHPSLQGVKTIHFSGDGIYHQLNLNTLFNPKTKQYLLDELDIHLVSSTRDLLIRRKMNTALTKATLVGYPAYNDSLVNDQQVAGNGIYPALSRGADVDRLFSGNLIKELPGTQTEVTGIAGLLGRQQIAVDLLTGTQATEAALKRVHNPNILHIATHGFFRKQAEQEEAGFLGMERATLVENPLLRSGLLLAGCQSAFAAGKSGSRGEDGVLTAYEAMSLHLDQTDLVVLSACETGLGEIRNGEGVYGLQRAFQAAGAKAVLMSLWKVDDTATQQLMSSFYKHWLASGNVRNAFKEAQHELRKKYPQPYYWGAFVLLGE
jgi:CHAT domain-containing protein